MFEPREAPLLPRRQFLRRFAISALVGLALIILSLAVGMAGYRMLEGMDWIQSFYNASMILSGMGPVDELRTVQGKIFAGIYAIYSGVALLTNAGIIFAPLLHRIYHKFHLADEDVDGDSDAVGKS